MNALRISPSAAEGTIAAPPSKSYTHRAVVLGRFAGHPYRINHPLTAEDTRATLTGVGKLGAATVRDAEAWTVAPGPSRDPSRSTTVDCRASGTTLRLLTVVGASTARPVTYRGETGLARRPMEGLLAALRQHGVTVSHPPHTYLPLVICGPIRPGKFVVDGSASSQFVTALLLVLPFLESDSEVHVTGSLVSQPYVAATVALLRSQGIRLGGGPRRWSVPGNQGVLPREFTVPADASSAAYLWAAAAVTGGRVVVTGLRDDWPQADLRILEALGEAGCQVRRSMTGISVEGRAVRGFDLDLTPAPDLYPLLATVAATIPARSHIRGAAQVVFKESDRRRGTFDLLRRFGARCKGTRAGLEVEGRADVRPLAAFSSRDHRLVMSAAVGALAAGGASLVGDAAAVRKSFPGFWESLRALGASIGGRGR
ncbi:MAG TPA: 3-phosphoshikimate 1-carboxyvinyltransferase [Thermoplasmata archaeon]|nr:3-phosphoshikimate 1-carboxyvinyltransferase [Thermoplasmata archaeon]